VIEGGEEGCKNREKKHERERRRELNEKREI